MSQSQQMIPDAAAHHIGGKACIFQSLDTGLDRLGDNHIMHPPDGGRIGDSGS